ncbi:PepSY domain-containing protein [Verticiella sediminum]|uniref:PepSY domain-containing protein n=1 Tax=Verticiella sediminum TaxID=1247510 RepID=A0A556B116_9BURK|nr:PepSY-associated TM helix domain-containing protein [Verticiella sediminum]TSH98834.1 PepSY domain-containing protein [Verticiella sediminum]
MKTARSAAKAKPPGIRQTMSDLHIWVGLLAGWILYAMFLTGTVSYFKDEISQWMRPEVTAPATPLPAPEIAQRMVDTMARIALDSSQWSIGLPHPRRPTADVFWRTGNPGQGGRGFQSATFDGMTAEPLEGLRDTDGGEFFYRFHFQLHYMSPFWGRWIAGLCAMFMLVAIISGVITHKKIFIDFFTFRWGKGQRSWLDAHNAVSVFGLPFHAMITYTGLVTLMLMYMPWGSDAALRDPGARQAAFSEMSAFVPAGKPVGQPTPLTSVADVVRQAQAHWGGAPVARVLVNNPGDASARIVVSQGERSRVSYSPHYIVFDGVSGAMLQAKDSVSGAAETRGVLYGLHLGRFADLVSRWLYFIVSLAGTAMVGTGLVLWVTKRRQRLAAGERAHLGIRIVERLNVATIAGLSLAMTGMLWANRLLPPGMAERAAWEIHVFFMVWGAALLYSLARPVKRAWIELLWASAGLLALTPVLNALTTSRGLPGSLLAGDWTFAVFDLMLLAFAVLHAAIARRVTRHKPSAKPARRKPAADAARDTLERPA